MPEPAPSNVSRPPSLRSQRLVGAGALLGLVFLGALAVHVGTQPLRFGDQFWQLRAGQMILEARRVIDTEPFSYTAVGVPWNNHQWGYEVLVALLYQWAGWGAFRITTTLLVAGPMFGIWLAARRTSGAAMATLAAAVFLQLAHYKFNPASQTLCMAMFFATYAVFLRDRTLTDTKRGIALALVMLAWGNLTAEALIFLPFVAWDQTMHAISVHRDPTTSSGRLVERRRWLLLGLVCVAPMVNPPGSSVLDYALAGSVANRITNTEFVHLWEPAATVGEWSKWMARAIAGGFLAWAGCRLYRTEDRVRVLRYVGPGLGCVAAATIYERYVWMLAIPVVIVLARSAMSRARRQGVDLAALGLAIALTVPFLVSIGWTPGQLAHDARDPAYYVRHLDERHLPIACTAYINAVFPTANVATYRKWGGYVIFAAPRARVFIDGRNLEYPLEVHRAEQDLWRRTEQTPAILEATGTDIVMAAPGWSSHPLLSGWHTIYESTGCAVYARRLGGR